MANYDGLTRNAWTGTWPHGDPIVLDTEIRGGLRHVSGDLGDSNQLTFLDSDYRKECLYTLKIHMVA